EEKSPDETERETALREALERRREEEEKQQAETLLQQIEELKLQESKTAELKKEQENLLKQRWELESLEEERRRREERRQQKEPSRFLRHQCDTQLKRRARQIQEELELDRQTLLALLEKEDEEQQRQCVRPERAAAAWLAGVMEEQLQLEKQREAELQVLFREEAKKVWEKREDDWERERAARDCLMNEVMPCRRRQIQEQLELNRRAQAESIKYREQLIKDLEEAKELRRQKEEQLKTLRRQELEAQV
ncbi:TCHP protein, partial [Upupa epops]|nr:TCHP protein [Upupa epops]